MMNPKIEAIEQARVLVVGAGGVGSEVLKGLILTGLRNVEIVDLDVIELTNLNRQLLYRRRDIGRPKAEVAVEALRKIGSNSLNLVSHTVDIRSKRFDTKWFCSFDCIIGTLDNLASRQHLNMMSVASGVPLIESGTEGFKGQVTVHIKGKTRCYDCDPKPASRQSYAVCTIRSRPAEPVHCIVWAREYLFETLFGEGSFEDNGDLSAASAIGDDGEFVETVFTRSIKEDAARSLHLGNSKVHPLSWDEILKCKPTKGYAPNQIWSLEECAYIFEQSILRLRAAHSGNGSMPLTFDKDDDTMLDFITSTANMRSHSFGIGAVSRFEAKQMAARVVPAVSTTNAIVSGLIILQLLSLLQAIQLPLRNAWISPTCIVPEIPITPRATCVACSALYFSLRINLSIAPLQTILRIALAVFPSTKTFKEDEITVLHDSRLLYDADFTDNLLAPLSSLNITHSDRLHIMSSPDVILVFEMLNSPKYPSATHFKVLPSSANKVVRRQHGVDRSIPGYT